MILQEAFTVEPWNLRETHLDLDILSQTESVFALANGYVGWRGNLEEGERCVTALRRAIRRLQGVSQDGRV